MATEESISRKTAVSSLEDNPAQDHTSIGENCNQSSCQSPTIRIVNADQDAEMTCVCPCTGTIMIPSASKKQAVKSGVKVVTYKKRLGPDKLLVVKQEIEVPRVTAWIVFHGVLFILFLSVLYMVMHTIFISIAKAEEIMAVLLLLLLMLAYFRPRYFIPYVIFNVNGDEPEPKSEEDDSQIDGYLCCE